MFLPIRADFPLPGIPFLTIIVCLVCGGIFMKQSSGWDDWERSIERYCMLDRTRIEQMVFARISEASQYVDCGHLMYEISSASDGDTIIDDLVVKIRPLAGLSASDSQAYVRQMLQDEVRKYKTVVPPNPDHAFAYYTGSWNPWHMFTSAFAHGDWAHIVFNLIFFIAFAATVETLMGPLMFAASILVISLFTGVFSSVSAAASGEHYWTLGLSGVVMGMMGLFTYLLPTGKIRCYYWLIVVFGSVAIPAWALTLWYVGGDIYRLFAFEDHGMINVMAHVTGGISGYLFGLLFLRNAKAKARDLQFEISFDAGKPRF